MFRSAIQSKTIQNLGHVAIMTATLCAGGFLYMQEKTRKKFKECEFFKETMRILLENKSATTLLGEPITSGKLDLYDSNLFYVAPEKAKLTIPVKGSRQRGVVYSWCVRRLPAKDSMNDNEQIKIPNEQKPTDKIVPETANAATITVPMEKASDNNQPAATTQIDEDSKIAQWRVMRVEILLEQVKGRRLLVYKTPEADKHFVETFDDFFKKQDNDHLSAS